MGKLNSGNGNGEDPGQALRRQLLERLLSGQFTEGARFYSVREVAQWPSATTHLAQQALQSLCREGYLESVPKKGLFVRGVAKRKQPAADGAWRLLTVLIPPGADQRRMESGGLLQTFSSVLDPATWRIEPVYMTTDYQAQGGFPFAERLISRHPTAVMWLFPNPADMLLIRYLVVSGIMVATYNRDFSSTGAMGVVGDVRDVARQMFDELWQSGKRRIASVAVDRPSPSIAMFVQSVQEMVAEKGITDYRHVQLPLGASQLPTPDMKRLIYELLDGPDRPDAILCAEYYSLWVLEMWLAEHRDVRVPEDLGIAAFDRVQRHHVVRLLPIIPNGDFDHEGMMRELMAMVEEELAGRRVDPKLRVVPAMIIVDETVGAEMM